MEGFWYGICLGLALFALIFNIMDGIKIEKLDHRVSIIESDLNIVNKDK